MQLKKCAPRPIGAPLAAATCALLGHLPAAPLEAQELAPWDIDTSALLYSESEGRVRDFSVNGVLRKELREDRFLGITFALDTLTGASPSGAVPSTSVQTFTRPSGNAEYSVAPGEQPLDDTFQDTRVAFAVSWEWPLTRLALLNVGASFSDEYDYTHTGLNAKLARDFNNRNTTLSVGLALANDSIDPVGGSPVPLAPMLGINDLANKRGDRSKDVTDILLGVTQVLSRNTIVQLNFSLSQSDGYLTDPYKVLSVVDPVTGDPVAGPPGSGRSLYLYESRPETRDKQSVYALLKRNFSGNVLDVSYRYMTDDWGVDSQTVDLHYRWNFASGRFLTPHLRFYSQTAADFYETVLFDGAPLPAFASADYRLGELDGITYGIKFGKDRGRGGWSARLEWYRQTGSARPNARVGALEAFDLYPDLDALIAQFTYKLGR